MTGRADDNRLSLERAQASPMPMRRLHAYLSARISQSEISGHMNSATSAMH
jgi:hypothetical protein